MQGLGQLLFKFKFLISLSLPSFSKYTDFHLNKTLNTFHMLRFFWAFVCCLFLIKNKPVVVLWVFNHMFQLSFDVTIQSVVTSAHTMLLQCPPWVTSAVLCNQEAHSLLTGKKINQSLATEKPLFWSKHHCTTAATSDELERQWFLF